MFMRFLVKAAGTFVGSAVFVAALVLVGVLTWRHAMRPLQRPPRPRIEHLVSEDVIYPTSDAELVLDVEPVVIEPVTPRREVYERPRREVYERPVIVPDTPPEARVTLAEFQRVRSGMTLTDVREVIGFPGEQNAESWLLGHHYEIWSWANEDGSNMNVQFLDGKSHTKAQFGLK